MNDAAIDYLSELGRADGQMREGNYIQAALTIQNILPAVQNCSPEYKANIYLKLGKAYALGNRHQEAVSFLKKSIVFDETLAESYQYLCSSLTRTIEIEKAIEYGEKGLEHGPESVELLKAVLEAKRLLWQIEESLELMENSPAFDREDPFLLLNYGLLLHETGQKERAHDALAKALEKRPDYAKAHRMFSYVHRYDENDIYMRQLRKLVKNKSLPAAQAADAHFALAKAYEDCKDFERSFKHYKYANDNMHAIHAFSFAQHEKILDQIKNIFTAEYISDFRAQHSMNEESVTPIFIVGMPRSGTSLTEQILSSHSEVFGAGELNELEVFLYKKSSYKRDDFDETWSSLSAEDYQEIASQYCKRLERDIDKERFVTDKLPRNFINCGVIMCLFPNAKIIHISRNPQANCFSLFKTYFTGMAAYSTKQKELVKYYNSYKDIISHWHNIAPKGAIYDITYEDLVQNPEETIKGLLEYCGLEWQDSCLEFHKSKRAVVTANAQLVKKPIYLDALQYWRNFEPYLDPEILKLSSN